MHKDDSDLKDSYFMCRDHKGVEIELNLGAVLFVGEVGGGTTLVILRNGSVIYSRSPYEDIIEDLEAYQTLHGGYSLVSILQGDLIQTAADLKIQAGTFGVIPEPATKEIH